jgi:membrane-associated phospholipid phosphatase
MSLHDLLSTITNLGDPVLLLPGAALLLWHLLHRGARRSAWLWLAAFALCVALTALSKLGLRVLGRAVLDINSPSGHTGLAATFYLIAAFALSEGGTPRTRAALVAAASLIVAAIAASRVVLRAHDLAEIAVGLLIGTGCALWFARRSGAVPAAPASRAPVLAAFAVLAVLVNGWHVSAESSIRQLAAGHWLPPPPHVIRHGADAWLVF